MGVTHLAEAVRYCWKVPGWKKPDALKEEHSFSAPTRQLSINVFRTRAHIKGRLDADWRILTAVKAYFCSPFDSNLRSNSRLCNSRSLFDYFSDPYFTVLILFSIETVVGSPSCPPI
jgi:hypothetical protein